MYEPDDLVKADANLNTTSVNVARDWLRGKGA